ERHPAHADRLQRDPAAADPDLGDPGHERADPLSDAGSQLLRRDRADGRDRTGHARVLPAEALDLMTERLWAPWRLEYVARAAERDGCIFCEKPGQDDDAALIVHRGTRAYVVLKLYPYTNGHLMVAPYRHLAMPDELDPDERTEVWQLMADGIAALT